MATQTTPGGNIYENSDAASATAAFTQAVAVNRDARDSALRGYLDTQLTGKADAAATTAALAGKADKDPVDALTTRVSAVEILGGLAPGDVNDATSANLIETEGTLTETALSAKIAKTVYDVPGPVGDSVSDTALVVAACVAAEAEGRPTVLLAPGHYRLDGLTVSGAKNRYLIGDGVTFSDNSWVYPFGTAEYAGLSSNRGRTGGRGRVAIEVDDGTPIHWYRLFKLTKELGITVGTAWHTDNGSQWIAEAYRHGWEVIHHMPENITATDYLTAGTLETAVQSGLAKIKEQIGTDQGLGFVYPQHVRSAETDRILSKYFTRGRGMAAPKVYAKGAGYPWLTSSRFLDTETVGGVLSEALKRELAQVAALDGQMVFYMHMDYATSDDQLAALRKFVTLCREHGIDIVNPGQIWGNRNVAADPYLTDATSWTPSGIATLDTARAYHGTRSVKMTPGAVASTGTATGKPIEVASRPGMFGVYRASVRYSADTDVPITAAGQGIRFLLANQYRKIDGGTPSGTSAVATSPFFPATGAIIPASAWDRIQELIYIGPATQRVTPSITAQNLAGGAPPLWLDEIKLEHIDWVSEVVYTVTLAGTGNVILYTGVSDLSRHTISVVPVSAPAGFISATALGSNGLIIKSTSASDTMTVKVVITPGSSSYDSNTLTSAGA